MLRGFFGGKVMAQTPEEIAASVKAVQQRTGARGIYFNDEEVFSAKPRTIEALERLLELERKKEIRADTIYYGQTHVWTV